MKKSPGDPPTEIRTAALVAGLRDLATRLLPAHVHLLPSDDPNGET